MFVFGNKNMIAVERKKYSLEDGIDHSFREKNWINRF